jgi:hypothetical protein
MKQVVHSIRLPPPFAEQDARVPQQSTTALPARPIDWMLPHHTSKIMTWGMHSPACEGLLAGIRQALW